jgi:translation initiation factor 2B subunit (eIF-2B alpha/beta/delta family)
MHILEVSTFSFSRFPIGDVEKLRNSFISLDRCHASPDCTTTTTLEHLLLHERSCQEQTDKIRELTENLQATIEQLEKALQRIKEIESETVCSTPHLPLLPL